MLKNQHRIWVELRFRGRSSWFEMRDGERPLGVGSGLCSDLRIDAPAVAMVHFELARRGDTVWLWLRADGDVRMNAAHVGACCRVPPRAVVEFLDQEIEVLMHPELPCSSRLRAALEEAEEAPPVTLGARWLQAAS
jgi:hypothetical protein